MEKKRNLNQVNRETKAHIRGDQSTLICEGLRDKPMDPPMDGLSIDAAGLALHSIGTMP